MNTKKVKVKVKKKKLKIKSLLLAFIFLFLLVEIAHYFLKLPIKNIYISGNKLISDKEIISLANIENYPPFIEVYYKNIKGKILDNNYIKEVTITRKINRKLFINIKEYKPICFYQGNLVLSSKKKVKNIYDVDYVPYVVNNIDTVYDKFVTKFSKIEESILIKISHVEYVPNEVDKERFLLYMIDSNYVYVTLSKIEKVNKYNSIVQELDNKKGIIYLDSGDYIEIKG